MNFVISSYPLSNGFRKQLESLFGSELEVITLSELRQRGIFRMGQYLLSINCDNIVLAIEDQSSFALLPTLKLLGALPNAHRRSIANGEGSLSSFNRSDALKAAFGVGIASIVGIIYTYIFNQKTKLLNKMKRIDTDDSGVGIFYLNANLWFGVKAGGSVGHISGVVNAFIERRMPLVFASVGGRLMVSKSARFLDLDAPKSLGIPYETTYYRFNFDCVSQCSVEIEAQRPKFIYQRMSLANIAGVQLSRKYKLPLVIEYNGSEVWVAKNWGKPLRYHKIAERAEKVSIKHADLVVTVSDVLGKELVSRGVDSSRIVVYPNCIDPNLFNPERFTKEDNFELRNRHGIPADAVVATFVGTFGEWHGADRLAEAIRILISERLQDVSSSRLYFLLVGDGIKMSVVKEILAPVMSSGRVIITGLVPQNEAPAYLAASDILLSPHTPNQDGTEFFGSPTKLFEYMAMEKAILASDLAQIGEVLQPSILSSKSGCFPKNFDSAVAVLTPPGDISALINGLEFLAKNSVVRKRLGANARALVFERYTWQHHVEEILSGLKRVRLRSIESLLDEEMSQKSI